MRWSEKYKVSLQFHYCNWCLCQLSPSLSKINFQTFPRTNAFSQSSHTIMNHDITNLENVIHDSQDSPPQLAPAPFNLMICLSLQTLSWKHSHDSHPQLHYQKWNNTGIQWQIINSWNELLFFGLLGKLSQTMWKHSSICYPDSSFTSSKILV